ncbi:protoporphyrinogen oxidase [Rossellomorea marisflavi]|uniref:Coproporphyrinogen III oxidase n=1 Tax=Rossellomorea marisflavi TaxID=189381 RepID=A0A0J5VE61_9BACI|nr:protoporphyrinogen oxidase [Rossellomorea marisflavi]KMK96857.1 protoporphyrinogen oxidase [Rossellomorea marisflavi]KML33155.1 protoporphyrinogen oxidase [Rossellomorea marisflavi]KZE47671.1 protoporphyrinogen oxidase [Rossellomorea marisflavi]MCM2603872.1 protoporphyrinogen oxidase [Rossellomorea marisflavi]QHA35806.1 protoporphyrinogen oxidase [Rossellomorea marisflavi]
MADRTNKRVVVIGGGITGLAATFYLQKEAREKGLPYDVKLVESTHRVGGKVQTVKRDGYVIEKGPDSVFTTNDSILKLAGELGISDTLVTNEKGKSFVIAGGELYPIPGGSIVGIPTQIAPFVTTNLFSLTGKMRAAADFLLPRSQMTEDQSLGTFFRRRMGDEVVDHLIEPLLTGIFAGDIDQMSLMSTFPQFYELEQKHRSLIAGIKKNSQKETSEGGFLTFTGGLQSMIDALEAKIEPGTVYKSMKATHIRKEDKGYSVTFANGSIECDAIILAAPHHVVQRLLPQEEYLEFLKEMPATSVATVAMGFDNDAIKQKRDGTEFLVSRNSDFSLTAAAWTHRKWPHTAPTGKALIRSYLGKPGDEAIVDLSDDQIEQIVIEDLNKIVELKAKPEFTIVSRYKQSMPQYTVGHRDRIREMARKAEESIPGIFITGSSFEGLSIPDCVVQGEAAVEKTLQFLQD